MLSTTPYAALSAVIPELARWEAGIIPTDTLYGVVGDALNQKAVERIYKLRRRNPSKPMIILIGDLRDLARFGIRPNAAAQKVLKRVWPGKVSVVLPLPPARAKKLKYLDRGTGALAFRLPEPAWLRAFLKKTGPLVAPSANFEGKPPALTIRDAKKYFGTHVRFYIDMGKRTSKPSTLIKIDEGVVHILRKGAVRV